jgi:hypothetical protein
VQKCGGNRARAEYQGRAKTSARAEAKCDEVFFVFFAVVQSAVAIWRLSHLAIVVVNSPSPIGTPPALRSHRRDRSAARDH